MYMCVYEKTGREKLQGLNTTLEKEKARVR